MGCCTLKRHLMKLNNVKELMIKFDGRDGEYHSKLKAFIRYNPLAIRMLFWSLK